MTTPPREPDDQLRYGMRIIETAYEEKARILEQEVSEALGTQSSGVRVVVRAPRLAGCPLSADRTTGARVAAPKPAQLLQGAPGTDHNP